MFKKYFTVVIVGLLFFNVAFAQSNASIEQDLLNTIKQLQVQIQSLQAQMADLKAEVQSVKMELNFTRALAKGTSGDDVKQLQEFLKTFPDVYPEGLVTGYFGPLTEGAIKKFQKQNGIESVGIVGPKTQEKLNVLAAAVPAAPTSVAEEKITICHTPSGNASNKQTIAVGKSALGAHVAHGDVIGVCLGEPTPVPPPTPPAETIPPSIPANFSATAISTNQIFLSWNASTDNVGVVGYKIYRGGAQIVTNALSSTLSSAPTSYSDTGLQASTAYTYTIAAYDAAGNMSAQSSPVSATTLPVNTLPTAPAPTSVNLAWWKTAGENAGVPDIGQYQQAVHFSYGGDMSTLQSFRVYLKRPGESSFTAIATFSNPASLVVTSGCSSQNINSGAWSIHYCVVNPTNPSYPPYPWQVLGSVGVASIYPSGEYDAYVTAVNTAGVEGPASNVASNVVAKATLLSPVGAQGSLTPTFHWTVPSGLPPLSYSAFSYGGPGILWNGGVVASAGTTDMSVTYDGPALDPSKTYHAHAYGEGNGYIAMGDSSPTFTVSQSCSLTVSLAATTPAAQNISPGQSAIPLVKFNATPNCNGTLNSFAVSLLPMPNGYQNISTLRLYNDANGAQLGTAQTVTGASVNFASLSTPFVANQTLVLKVVGDINPSAVNGSTVYGVFGGSSAVNSSGGVVGNNASGNIIMGNTMTVAASNLPPATTTAMSSVNNQMANALGAIQGILNQIQELLK